MAVRNMPRRLFWSRVQKIDLPGSPQSGDRTPPLTLLLPEPAAHGENQPLAVLKWQRRSGHLPTPLLLQYGGRTSFVKKCGFLFRVAKITPETPHEWYRRRLASAV